MYCSCEGGVDGGEKLLDTRVLVSSTRGVAYNDKAAEGVTKQLRGPLALHVDGNGFVEPDLKGRHASDLRA